MAVTHKWFGNGVLAVADGRVDWDTDTIKAMLVTGYVFDQDVHDFLNDIGATEVTGTGYTAGGLTLGSKTRTLDAASNEVRLDAADLQWTGSTISATGLIIYKSRGGASSADELISYLDFGGTVASTASTFDVVWPSSGVLKYVVA